MDQRDLLLLLTFLWGGFKVNLFRPRVHHKDADEFSLPECGITSVTLS